MGGVAVVRKRRMRRRRGGGGVGADVGGPPGGEGGGVVGWVGDRFAERSDGDLILLAERRPMGRAAVKDALERARRACP